MGNQKHSRNNSASSGTFKSTKKDAVRQGSISRFVERIHTVKGMHLFAGVCQFFLGLAVAFISILGFIHPFWLSAVLTVLASISITTGIYFCYDGLAKITGDTLLRDAMRRIVEDQN